MRILILLLIVSLTLPSLLHSQEKLRELYVIAPNGIKLREGPGTQYKVLGIVPYKSKVLLTDEFFAQKDSTQQIKLSHAYYDMEDYILTGAWLKIRYKNKNGYMLSTWLYPACTYERKGMNENINQDYQLYHSGNQAGCDMLPNPQLNNWYNITVNSNGQFETEKVKIEFLSIVSDMGYGILFDYVLRRLDNKKANFIIRSVKPLKEGELFQKKLASPLQLNQLVNPSPEFYKLDNKTKNEIRIKAKNEELKNVYLREVCDIASNETRIYFTKNERETLMHSDNFSSIYGITKVKLVADLDGDGILDYILEFEPDKATMEILFLSSEAENGNSHKAVASWAAFFNC